MTVRTSVQALSPVPADASGVPEGAGGPIATGVRSPGEHPGAAPVTTRP